MDYMVIAKLKIIGLFLVVPYLVIFAALLSGQSTENLASDFPGKVRLVLPKTIYATSDVETNIYFDNIILTANSANYAFDVRCDKGVHLAEKWTYLPKQNEAGDYPLTAEVHDDTNAVVARASSILRVSSAAAGAERRVTLLAVGDSLTEASIYTQRLLELCDGPNGPVLTLIGSRGSGNSPARGSNRHEGYSGWTAEAFVTLVGPAPRTGFFKRPETGSPFVYVDTSGQPKLDFPRYCQQFNAGNAPDFVTFGLGGNDIFYATDADINELTDKIFTFYDALVNMVRDFRRTTKIGIFFIIPPSTSQDGFQGYSTVERQTRWQFRRDQHRFIERLIEHYGGRQAENIYLIPLYLNLDCAHSYPMRASPWNAETTDEVSRVFNGTHPSPGGYRQIGDSIYCWMKACLSN